MTHFCLYVLSWCRPIPQSYGPEHLLTFSNLRRAGLLTEQAPGDTLTAVESKVSKLVTDKAAGESRLPPFANPSRGGGGHFMCAGAGWDPSRFASRAPTLSL